MEPPVFSLVAFLAGCLVSYYARQEVPVDQAGQGHLNATEEKKNLDKENDVLTTSEKLRVHANSFQVTIVPGLKGIVS
jgi:hypothetical protein